MLLWEKENQAMDLPRLIFQDVGQPRGKTSDGWTKIRKVDYLCQIKRAITTG